jgi:hypothetical protein
LGDPSLAILSLDDSDSFWHPAPTASEDVAAATGPLGEFALSVALLSGRPAHCRSVWDPPIDLMAKPGDPKPPPYDPAPPPPYTTVGPSISVPFVGAGRMTIDVTWPNDASALRFSLPVATIERTPRGLGFRIIGTGSRSTPLPASLSAWAGCAESQGWLLFLQALRDAEGKLVPEMHLTWGEGCNRSIKCSSGKSVPASG